MRQNYGKLGRSPKAHAVTGLIFFKRWAFVEKRAGEKDRKENQLCSTDEGQTTPYVEARYKNFEKYANNSHLLAEKFRENEVKEAEKLITELNLLKNYQIEKPKGNPEQISRANRLAANKAVKNGERIEEIVQRLSEIKSYLETLDNKLELHIEAAGDLMDVHVSNYWRGILKASKNGEVKVEPAHVMKSYEGRENYLMKSLELRNMLLETIENGGGADEE